MGYDGLFVLGGYDFEHTLFFGSRTGCAFLRADQTVFDDFSSPLPGEINWICFVIPEIPCSCRVLSLGTAAASIIYSGRWTAYSLRFLIGPISFLGLTCSLLLVVHIVNGWAGESKDGMVYLPYGAVSIM